MSRTAEQQIVMPEKTQLYAESSLSPSLSLERVESHQNSIFSKDQHNTTQHNTTTLSDLSKERKSLVFHQLD